MALKGNHLYLGLETSIHQVDLVTRTPLQSGLEEHRITALASEGPDLWAATVSIYNLNTPILYKTSLDHLDQVQVEHIFPPGIGHVERINPLDSTLSIVTALGVWYRDGSDWRDITPPTGQFVDCQIVGNQLTALLIVDQKALIVSRVDGQWQDWPWEVDILEPTCMATLGNALLCANASGSIYQVTESSSSIWGASMEPDPYAMVSNGQQTWIAYRDKLVLAERDGNLVNLVPSSNNLEPVHVFLAESNFFYICRASRPFTPVPCNGLYHWNSLGKLDVDDNGVIEAQDISALIESWGAALNDLDDDGVFSAGDLALVMSVVDFNDVKDAPE